MFVDLPPLIPVTPEANDEEIRNPTADREAETDTLNLGKMIW